MHDEALTGALFVHGRYVHMEFDITRKHRSAAGTSVLCSERGRRHNAVAQIRRLVLLSDVLSDKEIKCTYAKERVHQICFDLAQIFISNHNEMMVFFLRAH